MSSRATITARPPRRAARGAVLAAMLALLLLAVATAAAASAGPTAGEPSSLRRRAPQVVNIPGGVEGVISSLLPTATAKPAPASSSGGAAKTGTPAPTATGTSKSSGTTIKSVVTVTAAPTSTAATAVTMTTTLGSTATATPTPTADAGFFSKITGNLTILYSVIGGGAAILLGGAVAAYCCCCKKKRDSFTSFSPKELASLAQHNPRAANAPYNMGGPRTAEMKSAAYAGKIVEVVTEEPVPPGPLTPPPVYNAGQIVEFEQHGPPQGQQPGMVMMGGGSVVGAPPGSVVGMGPGGMPPGAMPPNGMPPGAMPPGAMPPNGMPPGAMGMGPPPPPTWGSPAGPGSAIGSAVGGPPSSVGGPGSAIGAPSSSLGIPQYGQAPHSPGAGPSSPYGAPTPFGGAPPSPYGAPTPYSQGPNAPGPGYPAPAAVASPYGGAAPVPPFGGGHSGANLGHPARDVRGEHMRPHLDRMAMSDVGAVPPSHYGGGSDVGLRHAASEVGTRAAPGAPYAGYGAPPPQHGPRGYPPRQQLQPHGDGGGSDVGSNLSVQSAGGGMRRVPSRGEPGPQGQYNPRQRSPSPMRMAPPGAGRPGY